jgi:hypothetical protein
MKSVCFSETLFDFRLIICCYVSEDSFQVSGFITALNFCCHDGNLPSYPKPTRACAGSALKILLNAVTLPCGRYKGAAGVVPQGCGIVGTCTGRIEGQRGSGPSHRGSLLTTVTSMDSPVTRPGSLTAVPESAMTNTTIELLPLSDNEKKCLSSQDKCHEQGNGIPCNH